jgi:hypothetical protein
MQTKLWIVCPAHTNLTLGAQRLQHCAEQMGWVSILLSPAQLATQPQLVGDGQVLPLTLEMPPLAGWAGHSLWQRCRSLEQLQAEVVEALGCQRGQGRLWLPLVNTARGLLFGEAIAQDPQGRWQQPLHLADAVRQPLYEFGQRLRRYLALPLGVHLLAADVCAGQVVFEQLLPFPGEPALASLGVQTPDLFEAHWFCLQSQPLLDLKISGTGQARLSAFA